MRSRAFSLIEVMSAAAIVGVGLAATFTALGTGAQLFEHQRHTTHGIHLSEGKLEELLMRNSTDAELVSGSTFGPEWYTSLGFATPAASCATTTTTGVPPLSDTCRYRVTWSSAPGGVPNVRVLTVTTAWNERGQEKSVSFQTQRN
jgi:prepilin-type N-terminal cleavage/methylation domain-containing protein